MALWGVMIGLDQRMRREHLLHAGTLDTNSPTMNQPHVAKPRLVGRLQVLIDY